MDNHLGFSTPEGGGTVFRDMECQGNTITHSVKGGKLIATPPGFPGGTLGNQDGIGDFNFHWNNFR